MQRRYEVSTVVGDVEIAEAEESPINRDLGKANEIMKDTHSRTNINVEMSMRLILVSWKRILEKPKKR